MPQLRGNEPILGLNKGTTVYQNHDVTIYMEMRIYHLTTPGASDHRNATKYKTKNG
jgi:hypothetical protein